MGTVTLADKPAPRPCVLAVPAAVADADADKVLASTLEAVTVGTVERVTVVLPGNVAIVWPAEVVSAVLAMRVVVTAEAEPQSTCELRALRQISAEPTTGTEALADTPTPGL